MTETICFEQTHLMKEDPMALLLFLVLTLALFGLGFTVKILWWVALVMMAIWLIGLVAHAPDRRWYRW